MRRLVLAFAAIAAALAVAPAAHAGEYWVHACTNADGRNDALSPTTGGSASTAPASGCVSGAGAPNALRMETGNHYPDGAGWQFCAPPGTRVKNWNIWHSTTWFGAGFMRQVDTGPCGGHQVLRQQYVDASLGGETSNGWLNWGDSASAPGLRITTYCVWFPCGGTHARTHLANLHFLIEDYTPPSVTGARGLWGQGGWVRGAWSIAFDASDSTGVRTTYARVDGEQVGVGGRWDARDDLSCQPDDDVTRLSPCASTTATLAKSFDTTSVADGRHDMDLWAEDGGHNWKGSGYSYFDVDNTSPSASLIRAADSYGRTVTWKVSDARSGVDGGSLAATYSTDGGASWHAMSGTWDAAAGTHTATIPAGVRDGDVQVRVAGHDNAIPGGNAFTTSAATVTVETAPPPKPSMTAPGRWLNTGDPDLYDVELATPGPAPSGIAGYSVTRDGSDPDATVDVTGATATWRVASLSDGATTVKARAVSGTGAASDPSVRVIRVDRELPTATLSGAGSPATPHPGPITVLLAGHDGISGMGEAAEGAPVADGAYVAYRLDGADWVRVRGDEAAIPVDAAGAHMLRYLAVDAAGNASPEGSRAIVIQAGREGTVRSARFHDRSANARTTFTAARRFGEPCPPQATLTADRAATLPENDPDAEAGGLVVAPPQSRRDSLVGFPLPAAPDCTVASATLRLDAGDGAAGRPIEVKRASAAWTESAVTWNTRPGTVGIGTTTQAAPGWMEWDVTAQIQALYAHGDNGLYLRDAGPVDPSGGSGIAFRLPQLVLRFSE